MPIKSSRVEADIILQSLSEIIMRNKFGGFQISDITKAVDPNAATLFSDISGKGYLYSSMKFCMATASQYSDYGRAIVDGITSDTPSLYHLLLFNSINGFMQGFPYLTCYNETSFLYGLAWPASITIETSHQHYWVETQGNSPTVRVGLLYTVI